MKLFCVGYRLAVLGCLLAAPALNVRAAGDDVDLGPTTKTAAAYVSGEFIYPLDNRPTPQCHASTLAELPNGDIVAAWFAGIRERDPGVEIAVARYSQGKWTRPELVADGILDKPTTAGVTRWACWNPVLFQPQKPAHAPLLLFYKVGPSPSLWWGLVKTSSDGGKTWSKAVRLPEGYMGPVKDKPIQLEDGTLLCPSSVEGKPGGRYSQMEYAKVDEDGKLTWTGITKITDPIAGKLIQPTILRYANGDLQLLNRSQVQKLVETWSHDSGKTWSPAAAIELPNPDSGVDAVTLQDGRQLLVYNHTEKIRDGEQPPPGVPVNREMLNVAISKDGKAWKPVLVLEDAPRMQYSYPAVIQTRDGKVHITYTWKRQTIKHAELDPEKL